MENQVKKVCTIAVVHSISGCMEYDAENPILMAVFCNLIKGRVKMTSTNNSGCNVLMTRFLYSSCSPKVVKFCSYRKHFFANACSSARSCVLVVLPSTSTVFNNKTSFNFMTCTLSDCSLATKFACSFAAAF